MDDQLDCRKCGDVLSTENFWVDPTKPRGYSYWCKPCDRVANRAAVKRKRERESTPCSGCQKPVSKRNKNGKCLTCQNKDRTGLGDGSRTKKGYKTITVNGRNVLEHRHVMSEHLSRPLFKGENVHHKNGVRDFNEISNLELWVSFQPSGQRPEDLLVWADEIIRRYRDMHVEQDGNALS